MQTNSQEQTSTLRKVPTLSLGSYLHGSENDKLNFIEQLFIGMKDYGFIILKDHSVPVELLTEAYQVLERLYSLSASEK